MFRLIKSFEATSYASTFQYTDVFSTDFDAYCIKLQEMGASGNANTVVFTKFIDSSGNVLGTSNYKYASYFSRAYSSFFDSNSNAQSYYPFAEADDLQCTGEHWIFNPARNGITNYFGFNATYFYSDGMFNSQYAGTYQQNDIITGFQLQANPGYSTTIKPKLSIFGVRVS